MWPSQMSLRAEPCGLPSVLPHVREQEAQALPLQRPSGGLVSAASQEDVQFPISGVIVQISALCNLCSPRELSLVKEQEPSPLC